jgi:hypothetical protein
MRSDILPLFLALAVDYNHEVALLRHGECGGYAYRQAHAANAFSDHSSGTALDLNWGHEGAQGPRGGMATMSDRQIAACALLKKAYKVVIWGGDKARGGDYALPKNWDPMHYAIRRGVTVAQVRQVIHDLDIDENGVRNIKHPHTVPPFTGPYSPGTSGPAIHEVQLRLRIATTSVYDPTTVAAVVAYKKRHPLLLLEGKVRNLGRLTYGSITKLALP